MSFAKLIYKSAAVYIQSEVSGMRKYAVLRIYLYYNMYYATDILYNVWVNNPSQT